jgi:RNA polymerase sigma-70 factor, ECF subfamily
MPRGGEFLLGATESLLIERACRGDANAVGEIYERHYPAIYSYLFCRLGQAEPAENLTTEVFVRLVAKLDTQENRGMPILSWLHGIAHHLLADHVRRHPSPQPDAEVGGVGVAPGDPGFTGRDVEAAMDLLTEPQRQIVWLKLIEGRSNAEVAAVMGQDDRAVKSLQHLALATMRRRFEKEQSLVG